MAITVSTGTGPTAKTVDITAAVKAGLDSGKSFKDAFAAAATQQGVSPVPTSTHLTAATTLWPSITGLTSTLSTNTTTTNPTTPTTPISTGGGGATSGGTSGGNTSRGTNGYYTSGGGFTNEMNAEAIKYLNDKMGKVTEADLSTFLFGDATSLGTGPYKNYVNNYQIAEGIDPLTGKAKTPGGLIMTPEVPQTNDPTGTPTGPDLNGLAAKIKELGGTSGITGQNLRTLAGQYGYDTTNYSAGIEKTLIHDLSGLLGSNFSASQGQIGSTTFNYSPSGQTLIGTLGGTHSGPGGTTQQGTVVTTGVGGSVNAFSPGTEAEVQSIGSVLGPTGSSFQNTARGANTGVNVDQFTTDQQLAMQQAELNRQQLEGGLNQRGISQSGRGDLLRDVQGLQSELQVGQTADVAPQTGGPGRFAIGDGSEFFRGPAPEAAPAAPVPMGSPAFNALKAPEVTSLNEPEGFGDLRAALGSMRQAQNATLGQVDPNSPQAPGAHPIIHGFGSVMPGFGNNSLDPWAQMQSLKNGVGTKGRNLATPEQMFQIELDRRNDQRRKSQSELAGSILQSWKRAQTMQAQQDDLMERFRATNQSTGQEGEAGPRTAIAQSLREQIMEMERQKQMAAEQTQKEWAQWQAEQKRILNPAPDGVLNSGALSRQKQSFARAATKSHENNVKRFLAGMGMDPNEKGANGISNLQMSSMQWTPKQIETILAKNGRGMDMSQAMHEVASSSRN